MNIPRKPRILLQISASIAAFKAVALCSKLIQAGHEVEVILSPDSLHFVGGASFEGLTGKPVHQGNFEEGSMMAHIKLERWADLILLYPASANQIAQLAQGLSYGLIGSVFLAHEFKKPYWVAPAMNQAMIAHPATLENIQKLKEWKVEILSPETGTLACGEEGQGRLAEPEFVLQKITRYFEANSDWRKNEYALEARARKSILITSGGTLEPIDPVRSLTNFSTGQTGFSLAQAFSARGDAVVLLQSKFSAFQASSAETHLYDTTSDFSVRLEALLRSKKFDVIIHAAAVSDYAVESVMSAKGEALPREMKIQGEDTLLLKLVPNPKILKSLRGWSLNPQALLISFKLTTDASSKLMLDNYESDFIVHNHLSGVDGLKHDAVIFKRITGEPRGPESGSSPSEQTGKYEKLALVCSKKELFENLVTCIDASSKPKEEHL